MNRTLEEAALLVADLARLKTKQLTQIRPEIIALRDRIRELAGPPVKPNPVREALDKARSAETAGMTDAEIRDWDAKARASSTIRMDGLQCLECGEWFELLSMHVQKGHRLEWEEYLARWDLLDLDERFDIGDYPKASTTFIARQRAKTLDRMKDHPEDYTGENLQRFREKRKALNELVKHATTEDPSSTQR